MNLAHLYYFRKLVEAGSYSSAADELFISQPTLSLAISSLEKELGAPLLRKKRNGIELTDDGEEFYNAVLTATNALDSCISNIKQRSDEEYSTIRVGSVYSIQCKEWSNLLQEYRKSSGSKIKMVFKQSITKSLLRDLKSGELDAVFSGVIGSGDPEIEAIPCYTQDCVAVVHKSHPLANRAEISLNELAGYDLISYRISGGPFDAELANLLNGHKNLKVRHEFGDEISLCSMVVGNPHTIALAVYSWLVPSFPDIVPIKITDPAASNFHRFYFCFKKRGRKPLAVESFINFCKNQEYGNTSPALQAPQVHPTETEEQSAD